MKTHCIAIVLRLRWQSNSFCPTKPKKKVYAKDVIETEKKKLSVKLHQLYSFALWKCWKWVLPFSSSEPRFNRHLIVWHWVKIILYCFTCYNFFCCYYEFTCNFITLDEWPWCTLKIGLRVKVVRKWLQLKPSQPFNKSTVFCLLHN